MAVIANASNTEQTVELISENTKWKVIADGKKAGLETLGIVNGNIVTVPPLSAMILVQK